MSVAGMRPTGAGPHNQVVPYAHCKRHRTPERGCESEYHDRRSHGDEAACCRAWPDTKASAVAYWGSTNSDVPLG